MNKNTIVKVEFEVSEIDLLIDETMPLLKLAHTQTPDHIETMALGLFLHSFYNGVENIMKLIVRDQKGKITPSSKWHKDLFDLCFDQNEEAIGLFSNNLKDTLFEYLRFRHFIRNAYSFRIKWERMASLVLNIYQNWDDIKNDIRAFLKKNYQ